MPDFNQILLNILHTLGKSMQTVDILGMIETALNYIPQNLPEIYHQAVQTFQNYLNRVGLQNINAEIVSPFVLFIMTRHAAYSIIKFIFVLILFSSLAKTLANI